MTWWWNDNVDIALKVKQRFWKSWKEGGSKQRGLLETKRAAKRAAYDIKRAAAKERFGDVVRWEDDRAEVFKIVNVNDCNKSRCCCWGQMREK